MLLMPWSKFSRLNAVVNPLWSFAARYGSQRRP